jgi:uncharacterized protein VirK/YbjX
MILNSMVYGFTSLVGIARDPGRHLTGRQITLICRRWLRLIFLRSIPFLRNFRGHLKLLQTLSLPHARDLLHSHPRLAYKYLGGNYLARTFSATTRLRILHTHYHYLMEYVCDDFLAQVFAARQILWEDSRQEHHFSISLSFPHCLHHPGRRVDHEGDLSLLFQIDGTPVYVICFTIAPGEVFKANGMNVGSEKTLFIARIQGEAQQLQNIRRATKLLHEISPRDLLLVATQALATSLDIDTIVGINSANQLATPPECKQELFFDYEKFWSELGADRLDDGFYTLPVPLPQKPLAEISQHHRTRTLRKREFKRQVMEAVAHRFNLRFSRV